MTEGTPAISKGVERRGGYTGSRPATEMGPPAQIPSATARNGNGRGRSEQGAERA